jgi:hypothetical protein
MSVEQSAVVVPVGELSELDKLALRLGVVQLNRMRMQQEETELRAQVVKALRAGGKVPVYDPRNPKRKLWHATASETNYQAQVVDRTAAEEWVRENYPAKLRPRTKLREGFTEEDVLQVLRKHAGYMVEDVEEVQDWVLHELELKSQQAGEPMGWGNEIGEHAPPGIVVTKPDSTVLVKFTPGAFDAINSLIVDRVIDLDGNIIAAGGE